jgi:hypothetical protein
MGQRRRGAFVGNHGLMKRIVAASLLALAACSGPSEPVQGGEAPLSPAPFFAGDPQNGAEFAVDVSVWETPLAESQVDCLWASGVRHVVVGTQEADIAQQQLAMAVARGMTVDAYVYLYWDKDIASQVEAAFAMTAGQPIGRMWLDIEQSPGTVGQKTLVADIQTALATCQAHSSVGCGIYTGSGFWKTYMGNTNVFSTVPLWYAIYNNKTSLSNWSTESFGGWPKPVAKQFATKPLCGAGGVDWDVMQVSATPTQTVDRTLPPDTGKPPPAPADLYPVDGQVIHWDYAKVMSGTIPRATQYQLAIEHWNGSAWVAYYTYGSADAYVRFSPAMPNSIYRFRVRALNAHGWGDWSSFSAFDYGTYDGTRPSTTNDPPPQQQPPTQNNPPPPAGVPGDLSPPDGSTISTPNVTMTCSAVTSATSYQFAIQSNGSNGFVPYYTYTGSGPSRTFYPQTHGIDYRFQVRAMTSGTWGAWSSWATFHYD